MALTPGTRLGPYEVVAQIGVGGMGEVYKATDTNLKRAVAIKVLPASVAGDAERLARFQREAEVLAALNHPNIAQIHGLEKSDGTIALVMELVEGPTLADRIAQGAVPVDEALPIARQIAEALEAAHEQGIIHRDLKPANIKVRSDGTVKVLDFGLAKAMEPAAGSSPSMSMSPTITTPAMTQAGMILGTAAYMSPEQARGRPVDKRADIWAFGCVLYEMLTGRRAFDGEDVTEVLAFLITKEPNWSALPASTPVAVRALLNRCLQKKSRERVSDISTALFVLDEPGSLGETPAAAVAVPVAARVSPWRRATSMAAAAAVSALLAGAVVWWRSRSASPAVVRTTISTSGSTVLLLGGNDRDLAITPDGSRIVYRGDNQLLVRSLNQLQPAVLGGLGTVRGVFTSPDGEWVGFFDGSTNSLKKVAITGGPPVTVVSPGSVSGTPRGASWGPDGTIVFATNVPSAGLQRVSAAGGTPTVLTTADHEHGEQDHQWPEFLPGGKAVLFTITAADGAAGNSQIAVLDLESGATKVLVRGGSHAHYVSTGHLVYAAEGTLRAVAFDLGRLEVAGTPVPVLEGVLMTPQGAGDFAIAASGSLVYVPSQTGAAGRQTILSVDRQGRATPLPGIPVEGGYRDVRVSPDGGRLALSTPTDVWTYDLARTTLTKLTTDPSADTRPVWTPDGRRIVFSSNRANYPELFWRPSDGTGSDERLLARSRDLIDLRANGWSADGRRLLLSEVSPRIQCTIEQIAVDRPSDVTVLVKNEFCNDHSAVSPDGHWVAYESNGSGRYEIYVERYPELGSRQQISTSGGQRPQWSRDGKELIFVSPDGRQLFAVATKFGSTLEAGRPFVLFESNMLPPAGGTHPYDVGPGGRFFVIRSSQSNAQGGGSSDMVLVQNWFEELKRLVPSR